MAVTASTQTKPEARVLVVDDETNIVELLSVSLKFQGFEVYTARQWAAWPRSSGRPRLSSAVSSIALSHNLIRALRSGCFRRWGSRSSLTVAL